MSVALFFFSTFPFAFFLYSPSNNSTLFSDLSFCSAGSLPGLLPTSGGGIQNIQPGLHFGFRWGMLLVATDMFHRSASSMTWWPRANDNFLEISSLMKSSCAPMEARWHYCTVSRRIMTIGSKLSVTGNICRFFKRENPKKLYIRGCSNWETTYFHKLFSSKLPLYSHKRLLSS